MKTLLKKIRDSHLKRVYKKRCKKIGAEYKQGVVIGKNVKRLNKYVKVVLSENSKIHDNVTIFGDGVIELGKNTSVGENSWIYANKNGGVKFGDNVNCAANLYLIDSDHGTKKGVPMNAQPMVSEKVNIGNDVWIGANVTILKGVALGDGCVVGACSCVTKSFANDSIICGVPAKVIKLRS